MRLNPFNKSNPMTWKDAAKVSGILTAAQFFTVYMTENPPTEAMTDPLGYTLRAVAFVGKAFFTQFLMLTGLAAYMSRKEAE